MSPLLAKYTLASTIKGLARAPAIRTLPKTFASRLPIVPSTCFHTAGLLREQAAIAEDYSHSHHHDYDSVVHSPRPQSHRPIRYFDDPPPPQVKPIEIQPTIEVKNDLLTAASLYHVGREAKFERVPYWQSIPRWKDVPESLWLDYGWGVRAPNSSRRVPANLILDRKEHPREAKALSVPQ